MNRYFPGLFFARINKHFNFAKIDQFQSKNIPLDSYLPFAKYFQYSFILSTFVNFAK